MSRKYCYNVIFSIPTILGRHDDCVQSVVGCGKEITESRMNLILRKQKFDHNESRVQAHISVCHHSKQEKLYVLNGITSIDTLTVTTLKHL